MKKIMKKCMIGLLLCALLAGCTNAGNQPEQPAVPSQTETTVTEAAVSVIRPLPDTTMEALNDSIVNLSFGQNDFYRDASGSVLLRMQVYSYEKFDMVDIAGLKAGDTIILSGEEINVNSVERDNYGGVLVNGGLDEGGFDLATDDEGIYYEHGYSDMKSWYLVGEAECNVADSFVFTDSSDLEVGTRTYTAEDFMNGNAVFDYGYLPQSTTVRIENGQIVAMERIYTP